MSAQSQAVSLLLKAQKRLAPSSSWFNFASSGNSQLEESGDLFAQAANQFKIEKRFKEAGDAFAKEADCREKMQEPNEAATAWWNAAKAYKQGYPDLAVDALSHTITHFCATGKFRQAADREKDIALIYVKELNNPKAACESYDRAADWYDQEDATSTGTSCRRDAADLYAEIGDYTNAIIRYHKVANAYLESSLTRFNVKEIWLRLGLCALAMGDYVQAGKVLATGHEKDPNFPQTREYKFLATVTDAFEQADAQAFTDAVVEWNKIAKLDNWKTQVLLAAKTKLQTEGEGVESYR